MENRRAAQKQQLIESWNDAVTRHDVDGSIEILKQLDAFDRADLAAEQDDDRSGPAALQ